MSRYLNDIDQLRAVDNWATTYLWDIRFVAGLYPINGGGGPPAPFDKWFPASSVTEPLYAIETLPLDFHVLSTEIPKSAGRLSLSLEFYDNHNHVVELWAKEWFDKMFNGYMEVSPLYEVLKVLEVARLSPNKEVLYTNRYYVFPKGSVEVASTSQSALKKITMSLVVAGSEKV